jgi:hypothetical protein
MSSLQPGREVKTGSTCSTLDASAGQSRVSAPPTR